MAFRHVALIGLGEVGRIFARDLAARGVETITAYDLAFADPDSAPSRAGRDGPARGCESAHAAVKGAELVISAVTAAKTLDAAKSVVGALGGGPYFLDLNSSSPAQKQAAAAAVDGDGGRYVEAAVMTPVPPYGIASPMLMGGPHAEAFLAEAAGLGLKAKVVANTVGTASATKLCRSVMVKGVEALVTESMLAARAYGVEAAVLASLNDLLPNPDWEKLARYMISRSLEHGRRRAEEMREAAATVEAAGVEPLMSRAIAERQDWAADAARSLPSGWPDEDLFSLVDDVRKTLK
jgi:3-hydroxyisobutyrate dehydrogenase-like beta-hydroxyacid dehydrogenase